jgi:hypothetical protein
MEEVYERLPNEPLDMPYFDDLNLNAASGDDGDSDNSLNSDSDGDSRPTTSHDIVEEFRRERARDEETRVLKLEELQRREAEKDRERKKRKKDKGKKRKESKKKSGRRSRSLSPDEERRRQASNARKIKYVNGVPQIEVPELTMRTRRRGGGDDEPANAPVRGESRKSREDDDSREVFNF